jgi:hypothetical protein
LIEKLVVAECGPTVCGVNEYVNAHEAPAASVTPPQLCTPSKLGSPGAPPATELSVWGDPEMFVTVTSIPADVPPTAVVGKANVVGAIENPGVAVPDREMVPELSPLIEKLVDAECGPTVCGVNEYVNAQEAPAASVTPPQLWTPSKFASPGAPPATELNVCGDPDTFVTVTSIPADVPPTPVVGNTSVVLLKPNSGSAYAALIGTPRKTAVNARTSAARRRAELCMDQYPQGLSGGHILAVSTILV